MNYFWWGTNLNLNELHNLTYEAESHNGWPVSLCMVPEHTGTGFWPRYTVVFQERPTPADTRWLCYAQQSYLEAKLADWAKDGYFARLLSAYRIEGQTYFCVVAMPGPETMVVFDQPITDYGDPPVYSTPYSKHAVWYQVHQADYGYHPLSFSVYHNISSTLTAYNWPYNTYVASVWEVQPNRRKPQEEGWYYFNTTVRAERELLPAADAFRDGFAFPHLLCPIKGGGPGTELHSTVRYHAQVDRMDSKHLVLQRQQHLALYRDDEVDGIAFHASIDAADIGPRVESLRSKGLWPVSLQCTAPGPYQTFDLVFAEAGHWRERPRVLTCKRVFPTRRSTGTSAGQGKGGQGAEPPLPPPMSGAPELTLGGQPATTVARHASAVAAQAPTGVIKPAPVIDLPELAVEMKPMSGGSEPSGPGEGQPETPDLTIPMFDPEPIEQLVIRAMKRRSIRAAQLAVVFRGELKHAVAFTWAPEGYPITSPTTRMRIGSISKTITSFAMLKLAELGNDPQETSYDPINLFSAAGGNSVGALLGIHWNGWDKRSVAHLLCHLGYFDEESGPGYTPQTIDFCSYWNVANYLWKEPNPAEGPFIDRGDMLDYIRGCPPPSPYFEPLEPPALTTDEHFQAVLRYSGFGFERVGDIIADKSAFPYFHTAYERWVKDNIFWPLGVWDRPCRGAETAHEGRLFAPDGHEAVEVRYHHAFPEVWKSAWEAYGEVGSLDSEHMYAAPAYEGHNYRVGLAGGQWSLAVVDYARLLSSVDVPGLLLNDPASIERLFERSYADRGNGEGRSLGFFLSRWDGRGGGAALFPPLHNGGDSIDTEAGSPGGISPSAAKQHLAAQPTLMAPLHSAPTSLPFSPDQPVPYSGGGQPGPQPGQGGGPTVYHLAHHNGSWAGTWADAFRRDDGVVAVVAFNCQGWRTAPVSFGEMSVLLDIPPEAWPEGDLFSEVMDENLPGS